MNALDKAIEDLRAVVEAYARGKVDEGAFVLPANAVLAAYAQQKKADCACARYFSRYSCGAYFGECDCPKCQGYCDCQAAAQGVGRE